LTPKKQVDLNEKNIMNLYWRWREGELVSWSGLRVAPKQTLIPSLSNSITNP